jgi:hypothetical protein
MFGSIFSVLVMKLIVASVFASHLDSTIPATSLPCATPIAAMMYSWSVAGGFSIMGPGPVAVVPVGAVVSPPSSSRPTSEIGIMMRLVAGWRSEEIRPSLM